MEPKTIVVTGATSGIGKGVAIYFASKGINIVAAGRREDLGKSLVEEIKDTGGNAIFVKTDVKIKSDIIHLHETAINNFGKLNFAFNNAGIFFEEAKFHEYDDNIWDEHIAVGLKGIYLCMKSQLSLMLNNQDSHSVIVNNASTVGSRGSEASGAGYTAAKHGILGLTKQAAVEYAKFNITVNSISVGPTLTDATEKILEMETEARNNFLSELNPTGELIEIESIAEAIYFLCSSGASMINGHSLTIDGGQLAKL